MSSDLPGVPMQAASQAIAHDSTALGSSTGARPADMAAPLSSAMGRRVTNQVARVFRKTHGASTGLQILVQLVVRQMAGAGASREAIREALRQCVQHQVDGEHRDAGACAAIDTSAHGLTESMFLWADEEMAPHESAGVRGTPSR